MNKINKKKVRQSKKLSNNFKKLTIKAVKFYNLSDPNKLLTNFKNTLLLSINDFKNSNFLNFSNQYETNNNKLINAANAFIKNNTKENLNNLLSINENLLNSKESTKKQFDLYISLAEKTITTNDAYLKNQNKFFSNIRILNKSFSKSLNKLKKSISKTNQAYPENISDLFNKNKITKNKNNKKHKLRSVFTALSSEAPDPAEKACNELKIKINVYAKEVYDKFEKLKTANEDYKDNFKKLIKSSEDILNFEINLENTYKGDYESLSDRIKFENESIKALEEDFKNKRSMLYVFKENIKKINGRNEELIDYQGYLSKTVAELSRDPNNENLKANVISIKKFIEDLNERIKQAIDENTKTLNDFPNLSEPLLDFLQQQFEERKKSLDDLMANIKKDYDRLLSIKDHLEYEVNYFIKTIQTGILEDEIEESACNALKAKENFIKNDCKKYNLEIVNTNQAEAICNKIS